MTSTLEARLVWQGGERFEVTSGNATFTIDGESGGEGATHSATSAPSPMQALLAAVGGCMGIDVAMILEKGRADFDSLEIEVDGRRAEEPPRRFVAYQFVFKVRGRVEEAKVRRAVDLSFETYCSVWHSLAQDAEVTTRFDVAP